MQTKTDKNSKQKNLDVLIGKCGDSTISTSCKRLSLLCSLFGFVSLICQKKKKKIKNKKKASCQTLEKLDKIRGKNVQFKHLIFHLSVEVVMILFEMD